LWVDARAEPAVWPLPLPIRELLDNPIA
jgi:hypothetical protein